MAEAWARAEGPPSVANVGPGFDCMGIAVPAPGDVVWARRRNEAGVSLTILGSPDGLPSSPERNTVYAAAAKLLELLEEPCGVELVLSKRLPTGGSGLGSSGASAAASVAATAAALGRTGADTVVERGILIEAAAAGEAVAAGSPHTDNVAASLFGGIVLVTPDGEVLELPTPDGITLVVVLPEAQVSTADARAALPEHIRLSVAVSQAASLGALVHALHAGDPRLAGRSLVDRIAAPARAHLVPSYRAVLEAAQKAGALGASMSGSGPAAFALCPQGFETRVADAMLRTWGDAGCPGEMVHAGDLSGPGAIHSISLDANLPDGIEGDPVF